MRINSSVRTSVRGRFNLYAVAPQNANSYVACKLVVVDEQNLLALKNRVAATKGGGRYI